MRTTSFICRGIFFRNEFLLLERELDERNVFTPVFQIWLIFVHGLRRKSVEKSEQISMVNRIENGCDRNAATLLCIRYAYFVVQSDLRSALYSFVLKSRSVMRTGTSITTTGDEARKTRRNQLVENYPADNSSQ